jgi:hypothetical protein
VPAAHVNRFPDGLPERLLALDDLDLLRELGRPTLIRVPGTGHEPPRGVATLLHGDEDTGYRAALRILRERRRYPFDLYVVVGNIPAATAGRGFEHRFLDGQEDFNRVWGLEPTTPLRRAAREILAELRDAKLAALVDVHNNSGTNPFYAIVTRLDQDSVDLAGAFATTLLEWELGVATLMEAVSDVCPAIAVECGLPGRQASLDFALAGLARYLRTPPAPSDPARRGYELYGRLRKVVVKPGVRFTFGGDLAHPDDFVVEQDADRFNFRRVGPGHVVGRVARGSPVPLLVCGPGGEDVTDRYAAVEDGAVVLTRETTPVMMTRTAEAARKDCLFYLASPLALEATASPANRSSSQRSAPTSLRMRVKHSQG